MGSSLLRIVIIASLIANQEPPTYLKYRQMGHLFSMNHVNRKDLRKEFTFQPGSAIFQKCNQLSRDLTDAMLKI